MRRTGVESQQVQISQYAVYITISALTYKHIARLFIGHSIPRYGMKYN